MDPQQRVLLETSWEALGAAPDRPVVVARQQHRVFAGVMHHDYGAVARALRGSRGLSGTGGAGECVLRSGGVRSGWRVPR